jgi:hypothetical protein
VASEEENELIDEVGRYEEQDWKRIPGTVQEPVEYVRAKRVRASCAGASDAGASK